MAKLLVLAGHLGPRAEDALEGFLEVSEEVAVIAADALSQGMVLTVDLRAVELTPEIGAEMSNAMAENPYLQANAKDAEANSAPSIADRLAALAPPPKRGRGAK